MSQTLCVVLPVQNAQTSLAQSAIGLLEALADLAVPFELLIVDQGSIDATPDVARELANRFPQVRVLAQGAHADSAKIAQSVLAATQCPYILLCDAGCRLELADLHKLWPGHEDHDAVLAWPAGAGVIDEATHGQRLRAWRLRLSRPAAPANAPAAMPGYQLLHRRVLERIRWTVRDRYELLAELSRHGFRWQAVEVRLARPRVLAAAARVGESMRLDGQSKPIAGPSGQRRRISALKDFALGE